MDGLTQALLNRAQPNATPAASPPAVVAPSTNTPPAQRRFDTSQAMQESYRNGWSPNPILLRVMMGRQATK